ncbi:MAG TPA: GNAT family protein [Nocardioidaceae bacterium]|nr:GNAT family protein [Nocardioidaceae bacterium]
MHRFEPIADARPDDVPWPEMAWPVDPGVRPMGRVVALSLVDLGRDGADLFAALDHAQVWEHTAARPHTAEEYVEQLGRSQALGRVPWVVRLRVEVGGLPAGSVVGTSSYLDVSVVDARLEIGSTAYAPAVWGSTVNPETKLLLMTHAFEALNVGRVQLKTDVRNVRSQQAIARLGATYEGTLRRYQRRTDGSVRDTVMFSVTAEEWPGVKQGLEKRLDNAPH